MFIQSSQPEDSTPELCGPRHGNSLYWELNPTIQFSCYGNLFPLKTSCWNRNFTQKQKEVANQPKNRGGLFILNVSTTSPLRFVRIIHWGKVWPQGSGDKEVWLSHCQCLDLPSILGVIPKCLHISCPGVRWLHLIMKFIGSRSPMRKVSCFKQCPLFRRLPIIKSGRPLLLGLNPLKQTSISDSRVASVEWMH